MGKGARGVRGFKLVMVSAVSASSWRFQAAVIFSGPLRHRSRFEVERHESYEAVHLASGSSDPGGSSGQQGQRCQRWWSRRSALQVGEAVQRACD